MAKNNKKIEDDVLTEIKQKIIARKMSAFLMKELKKDVAAGKIKDIRLIELVRDTDSSVN